MKKIFTLIAAAAAMLSAQAEAPQLLFNGTPTVAGETYYTGYTVEVMDLGVMQLSNYTQDSGLFLRSENGEDVTVEVKSSDPETAVCSFGGCENGTFVTKTDNPTLGIDVEIDGDYTIMNMDIHKVTTVMAGDPNLSDITLEVTVYYAENPAEKTTAKVVMLAKPASEVGGIAGVESDASGIKLVGNTISYNMASPTKLNIFNANGGLVVSRLVSAQGSISLDALHPGLYIYSCGSHSGKILVRKH